MWKSDGVHRICVLSAVNCFTRGARWTMGTWWSWYSRTVITGLPLHSCTEHYIHKYITQSYIFLIQNFSSHFFPVQTVGLMWCVGLTFHSKRPIISHRSRYTPHSLNSWETLDNPVGYKPQKQSPSALKLFMIPHSTFLLVLVKSKWSTLNWLIDNGPTIQWNSFNSNSYLKHWSLLDKED